PADPATGRVGSVRKGARQVGERGPTSPARQHVAGVTEAPADPSGGTHRQPADREDQRAQRPVDGADCLRRSRTISIAIGIRDSTTTTTTTTGRGRSMVGTTLPSR